jgi:ABC-type Mn2+/Zn2+ transport system permease subunit
MLYTFGCLVLPALVAKNLCREVQQMFFVAPVVAILAGITGFVLANYYDYPPAQMTVALYCLLLVPVWIFRRLGNKGG